MFGLCSESLMRIQSFHNIEPAHERLYRTKGLVLLFLSSILFARIGDAQVRTAGALPSPSGRAVVTPHVVSGGSITLSMTGPTSLSINITNRMGTASNPLNNSNPINLTATYSNVNCTPLLFDCLLNPPSVYLYAYVPSTGLSGSGTYSIPASALEASTTTSGFTSFVTQSFGNSQPVVPPGPSFLIAQRGWNLGNWGSGSVTGMLFMNLNLSGVTSLPAGSYTGVLSIRAVITQ